MRNFSLVATACLVVLIACNNVKKPSDANFTAAINQYLAKHGESCTVIGRQFPVDVPIPEQREQHGIGPELAALDQAGLVHGIHTTAVVHGMLDALRGPTPPQPVVRYELTVEGRRYFELIPGAFGPTGGFCYGRKRVDSILKWTEPAAMGPYTQSEVTYSYKIADLAAWAQQPGMQQAFPDIRSTIRDASKADQIAGLVLTNKGWEVQEQ